MAFCLARTCIWQQEARKTLQSHVYVHEVALFKINKKTDACQNVLWSFFHLETNVKNTHNDKRKIFYIFDNMLMYLLKNDTYYLEFRNNEVEIRPIQNVQLVQCIYTVKWYMIFFNYLWLKSNKIYKNFYETHSLKIFNSTNIWGWFECMCVTQELFNRPLHNTVVLLSCRANWYTWPKY